MDFPSFYVVGAGGIGLLLQYLLQASNDCTLIAKSRSADRLADAPLKISGLREDMVDVNCRQWSQLSRLDPASCIFVTVKSHQLPSVLNSLKPLLSETNTIVLCQNGIGIFEMARQEFPKNPLLRLACWMGVQRIDLNHIDVAGIYKFDIAGEPQYEGALNACADILSGSGIPTTRSLDPQYNEWQKALWNITVNGLCSILNTRNGAILDHPEILDTAKLLVAETVKIAALEGVQLTEEDQHIVFASLEKTRTNLNATLQDLKAGRHPELEFLNGAVVQTAAKHGQKAALNETIINLVTYIEKTNRLKDA